MIFFRTYLLVVQEMFLHAPHGEPRQQRVQQVHALLENLNPQDDL